MMQAVAEVLRCRVWYPGQFIHNVFVLTQTPAAQQVVCSVRLL